MDNHTHHQDRRRLRWALMLTGGFMLAELVGGLLSGSLALLADAGHMLTDTLALGMALFASHLALRPADNKRTFGYERGQIIAALINGISLFFIASWIILEAIERLHEPVVINSQLMLVIAGLGLLINLLVLAILHNGSQHNMNIQGAFLHVIGDLLGSVAAIIAGLVILSTGWSYIDPILSILVAVLISVSGWRLSVRAIHVLLEGAPDNIDIDLLAQSIPLVIPEVQSVKHIHLWMLTPESTLLTMEITLDKNVESIECNQLLQRIKHWLKSEHSIEHSTIEIQF